MELFYSRPAGELVSYGELLELFSDVRNPWGPMWRTVSRYNRQLEGEKITLVKGVGYKLIQETKKSKLRDGAISELTSPGTSVP